MKDDILPVSYLSRGVRLMLSAGGSLILPELIKARNPGSQSKSCQRLINFFIEPWARLHLRRSVVHELIISSVNFILGGRTEKQCKYSNVATKAKGYRAAQGATSVPRKLSLQDSARTDHAEA